MIRRLFCALTSVMLLTGGALAQSPGDLVRLHVVAESDAPADQALKLELRDVCLRCARVCISDAPDADAAYMRLQQHLEDFRSACLNRARELGYGGEITVEAGSFDFPDRVYGDFYAPAGEYRALRITIGEGEGRNWWCILYPSLCVIDEQLADGDDPAGVMVWLKKGFGGALK